MAPVRKVSARDYEQALRRQELAAGRALVQALPADGPAGGRELAAARRVLTQALFELRRLGRELDQEIEGLRAKQGPGGRPGAGGGKGPGRGGGPGRGVGPGELDRYEAARSAVEEVAERWEGRRDQLTAELDRRQPGRGRAGQPGAGRRDRPAGQAQPRQGGQPRQSHPRSAGKKDGGEVRGRRGAAPARPERPRSRRSRRSPG